VWYQTWGERPSTFATSDIIDSNPLIKEVAFPGYISWWCPRISEERPCSMIQMLQESTCKSNDTNCCAVYTIITYLQPCLLPCCQASCLPLSCLILFHSSCSALQSFS
jgi:hypothetical protein